MYGYTRVGEDVIEAYLAWQRRWNHWEAKSDWFRYTPGVVTAINLLIQAETEEGDGVLIQEPVYYPFGNSIRTQKRQVISSPLVLRDGGMRSTLRISSARPPTPCAGLCPPAILITPWAASTRGRSCSGWATSV